VAKLRGAGVKVYAGVDELLAADVEAVWLPLPIDLHRSMTERALAAGKAVIVEKPAAGAVQDVDAMIAARDAAGLPVAVGFQDVYDPQILELKRKILAGELGRVVSAAVRGCWPRDERYYQRSPWAGAVRRNGVWVMDSPANNAMAHYINLVLFLLGPEEKAGVTPSGVEAELYRVNPIENYDTCSLRYELPGGVKFLVLMTHACAEGCGPVTEIRCERGTVRFTHGRHVEVSGEGWVRKASTLEQLHANMQRGVVNWLRGEDSENAAVATLEVARGHTVAVNGVSEAASVLTVPGEFVRATPVEEGKVLRSLDGIDEIFATCAAGGMMLHESGLVPWSVAGGKKDLTGYSEFRGPRG
jgi:predicted dehydrogenase